MTFRRLTVLLSVILVLFGLYLSQFAIYVLWDYRGLQIQEATEQDASGMSRLAGYSFMLMFGVVVLFLGLVFFSCRDVLDLRSQRAISTTYFIFGLLASSVSVYLQFSYWQSGWGRL